VTGFVAHVTGVDTEDALVAALAEHEDGTGRAVLFQAAHEPPDDQDVRLGLDTYCLVTQDQGTAYGCVRELTLDADHLRVVIDPDHLADLGLTDPVIEVRLAVPPESVEVLREALARILTYGRLDARPALLRLRTIDHPPGR
jgi:immunity protein 10 of polymorphic toxin system